MVRVGLVGCGSIAGTHAAVLKQLPGIGLVGFTDIIPERAQAFSDKYTDGRASVFTDYLEMLGQVEPDVIHLCTPHYLHAPMAAEALRQGVSVFSEKPPAISMEQFDELAMAAEISRARLGFCFQNRYNQTVQKADGIIAGGSLGEVTGVRAFVTWRRDAAYYESPWKGRLDTEGGGALINQSIHTLDLILRYLGEPMEVCASLSNHHLPGVIEVEDTVEAWMTFEGGRRACFYASTAYATDAPVILEIHCERGSIMIMDSTVTVTGADGKRTVYELDDSGGMGKRYWGNGHLACIRDFYDKLRTGERFQNDAPGVRTTMETMMKIYDRR